MSIIEPNSSLSAKENDKDKKKMRKRTQNWRTF